MLILIALALNIFFLLIKQYVFMDVNPWLLSIFHPVTLSLISGFICSNVYFQRHLQIINQAEFLSSRFLTWALILLGAQLSFADLALISIKTICLLLLGITLVTIVTLYVGRFVHFERSLTIWVLVGNCICGPTAISFASQFFKGKKSDLAKSIWINTIIGLSLMIILPVFGSWCGMDPHLFGLWVGSSLQSTAQVATSASLFSDYSADIALIIKSFRILLMMPFVLLLRWYLLNDTRFQTLRVRRTSNINSHQRLIPGFMIGFIVIASFFNGFDLLALKYSPLQSFIVITSALKSIFEHLAKYFLSVSMFGIGFLCTFDFDQSDVKLFFVSVCSSITLVILTYILFILSA